jgi:DNA-binding CsgD family transcriptional regulator
MRQRRRAFDTSEELLIQPYKRGIRLVRPSPSAETYSNQSIAHLFSFPTPVYFKDYETQLVDANPTNIENMGARSKSEAIKNKIEHFIHRSFCDKILKNDLAVITSGEMKVMEEYAERKDDFQIQAISFKFPCYQNEKVMGLFGCSIKIDSNNLSDLGNLLSQFMSTGLLGHAPSSSPFAFLPELKEGDIYFSKRECEVLSLLVRGKTAKEIGIYLQISKRTVETHIKIAKEKANCSSKSELIDKFVDQFI